jgi:2-dehydro-3-deoxygalactonokinase
MGKNCEEQWIPSAIKTAFFMVPALIALDWGTSNLRANLLDPSGHSIEQRQSAMGVMKVPPGTFDAVLVELCGDWMLEHRLPMVASGMVGSRQGWKEAPYLDCPATLKQAAHQLTKLEFEHPDLGNHKVYIAPGLKCLYANGQTDVMRGEETQIWGAQLPPSSICVLPGTHSKWIWLDGKGDFQNFKTFMTGELYSLLAQHSILGRLMEISESNASLNLDVFHRGVSLGIDGHAELMHSIFAARTAGLMGQLNATELPDFLSGILIGAEIGSVSLDAVSKVHLLGEGGLCERYRQAFQQQGISVVRVGENATIKGQWLLAREAGLVK